MIDSTVSNNTSDSFGGIDKGKAVALGYEVLPGDAWIEQEVDILVPPDVTVDARPQCAYPVCLPSIFPVVMTHAHVLRLHPREPHAAALRGHHAGDDHEQQHHAVAGHPAGAGGKAWAWSAKTARPRASRSTSRSPTTSR